MQNKCRAYKIRGRNAQSSFISQDKEAVSLNLHFIKISWYYGGPYELTKPTCEQENEKGSDFNQVNGQCSEEIIKLL